MERTRINISLNVWETTDGTELGGQLGMRTLLEYSLAEVFPSQRAQIIFKEAARKVNDDADASGPPQGGPCRAASHIFAEEVNGTTSGRCLNNECHPFVSVEVEERQRFCDQLMNKCSSLAPQGALLFDMGLDCVAEKYVFGLTFEKLDTSRQNQKFRVLLVRENLLRYVREQEPGCVHQHPYFQYRWRTLQQLHDLYFYDDGLGIPQCVAQGLIISSP